MEIVDFRDMLEGSLYQKKDVFMNPEVTRSVKSILFLRLQNQDSSRPKSFLRNYSPRTFICEKSTFFSSRNPYNSQKLQ